jgi:hypothetical protein
MNIRWLWASPILLAIACLGACATPVGSLIKEANRQNDTRAVERGKGLLAEHLKMVDKLRAEGDPMGDYLWTRANADRLIPNPISDPLVLKKMYEEAAGKGSVDAEHVLGVMLFSGSSTPSGFCTNCPVLKPEDRNPQLGVEMIDKATAKQCFYWSVELDSMANRQCLTPVVTALYVWPNFRDGTLVQKDAAQAARWRQLELVCREKLQKLPPQFFFQQKFAACR